MLHDFHQPKINNQGLVGVTSRPTSCIRLLLYVLPAPNNQLPHPMTAFHKDLHGPLRTMVENNHFPVHHGEAEKTVGHSVGATIKTGRPATTQEAAPRSSVDPQGTTSTPASAPMSHDHGDSSDSDDGSSQGPDFWPLKGEYGTLVGPSQDKSGDTTGASPPVTGQTNTSGTF